MSPHAHTLALHAIEDHTDIARKARCEMGRALDRTDPDDVKERARIQRDYGKVIAAAIRSKNEARAEAMTLYRELADQNERLRARLERYERGVVA